ncbi:Zn-ribbon domain-containing OB-fold protein [Lawsonibacter celer]|uniref:Zn-ribbon domain-containing OB-fold protein n=1 Tax=Lawsonibacter celer TaxID=2986526 RepID=UPI00164803E2|nr:zinc ribbon domain-containing protein [Lawsonibacter celer]
MTAITKQWYDYLEEGRLMGLKCKKCGAVHFPPFPICRECSGTDMEWVEISGEGHLDEIALVTAPDQWFEQYAPYYYAYAHVAEGSVFESMLVNVEGDPADVYEQFLAGKLDHLKLEIQKRDGYSYPVYRCV